VVTVTGKHLGYVVRDVETGVRGWFMLNRARLAQRRHRELGEVSGYCFYSTKLRYGDLAFDIGANHGGATRIMLNRGAKVVAVEPQAELAAEISERCPSATVLPIAISNEPGEAVLYLDRDFDGVASLDASWAEHCDVPVNWANSVQVRVTTLDELIDTYGEPKLIKIDTEGVEDRVLQGLSCPVEHVLFEVHRSIPDVASRVFERLENLGHYRYSMMCLHNWEFARLGHRPEELLGDLPVMGDVYARRVA
jgi:FkbM family methyltransferase